MTRIDTEYIKRTRQRDTQLSREHLKPGPESMERVTPLFERFEKACFNEDLNKSGPFYLRHFPILPKDGPAFVFPDYTKDPRYTSQPTKSNSDGYVQIERQ